MTDKSVHDATEEWVRRSITKEFTPIDINDVYKAFEAGAQWQSQQAQEFNGWYCAQCQTKVDPSEVTFHETHEACGRYITNDRPPAPASVPDERSHLIALLGVMCGWFQDLTKIAGWTPDNANAAWAGYRAAKAAIAPSQPAPAAVPEGWHISRTEGGDIIVQKSLVSCEVAS